MPGRMLRRRSGPSRFHNRGQMRGEDDEGFFCANCIMATIGVALVFTGVMFLRTTSDRDTKVKVFNDTMSAWDSGMRTTFKSTSFALRFAPRQGKPLLLPLSVDETGSDDVFAHDEDDRTTPKAIAQGASSGAEKLAHLRFVSRGVTSSELGALMTSPGPDGPLYEPISVTLVAATKGSAKPKELAANKPFTMYRTKIGHGNAKVCRNEHGSYERGHCYFSYFIKKLCFSVVHNPTAGWIFDPETPGLGCDVYDDWNYAQYSKDSRPDAQRQGGQTPVYNFDVAVRHGMDPYIMARDVTNREYPDFGASQNDLEVEGWICLVLGGLLLAGPLLQLYCRVTGRCTPDTESGTGHDSEAAQEREGLMGTMPSKFARRLPSDRP